jgi:GTP cyclohydrolase IA
MAAANKERGAHVPAREMMKELSERVDVLRDSYDASEMRPAADRTLGNEARTRPLGAVGPEAIRQIMNALSERFEALHDAHEASQKRPAAVATLCNEALAQPLSAAGVATMKQSVAKKFEEIFDILCIDHRNDHNTRDTPTRVAKMFVEELLRGRFSSPPKITEFENAAQCSQLIVTGPIEVRSMCAHHLMPIYGSAIVGVLPAPDGKIVGLSKYDRIVDYFAARFQIQEELVQQIAEFIIEKTKPRGLAIRISAVHMCKTHRGVRSTHEGRMVNSSFHGELLSNEAMKSMFLQECLSLEGGARR